MAFPKMTPTQIREQGIEALTKALGPVGMARFLQQFEIGSGDYTRDREKWLRDIALDDAIAGIKRQRKQLKG